MESAEEWAARIGSQEAMEKRVLLRAAGQLNAALKGPRGLGNVVQAMGGRKPHPLKCKCEECLPEWLREEMKSWPIVTRGMYEAAPKPVAVVKSKSAAPGKRRSKWSEQRGVSSN